MTPQLLLRDPKFQSLPLAEQIKGLSEVRSNAVKGVSSRAGVRSTGSLRFEASQSFSKQRGPREPHQMRLTEYAAKFPGIPVARMRGIHEHLVTEAMRTGRNVPPNVLKDYPKIRRRVAANGLPPVPGSLNSK
jgi:hypothetical protein